MNCRQVNCFVLLLLASCDGAPRPANDTLNQASSDSANGLHAANVNGVSLHYVERGSGEPIILVHGSLVDYREWEGVMQDLAMDHRVIAYSRRYNYPNTNAVQGRDHSAAIEAADLAAFVRQVGSGAVHIAGISFGALTALLFSIEHPELVRTLTVVEPPIMSWLPELPGGAAEYDQVKTKLLGPAAQAFRRGDREQALRSSLDFFIAPGAMDQLPPEVLTVLRSNLTEWEAIMTSTNAFPSVNRDDVRKLKVPVLMISGGRTLSSLRITDAELERLLQHGTRLVVPDGTHDVCSEQPATCATAIRQHVDRN